jgi:hypothetical protein
MNIQSPLMGSVWMIDKGISAPYIEGELAFCFRGATTPTLNYDASISQMAEAFNAHPYCKNNKITGIFSSTFITNARVITLTIFGGEIEYITILPGCFYCADTKIIPTIIRMQNLIPSEGQRPKTI